MEILEHGKAKRVTRLIYKDRKIESPHAITEPSQGDPRDRLSFISYVKTKVHPVFLTESGLPLTLIGYSGQMLYDTN